MEFHAVTARPGVHRDSGDPGARRDHHFGPAPAQLNRRRRPSGGFLPKPRIIPHAALLCVAATLPVRAQSPPTVAERILAAALIPGLALDARAAGAPERDIAALLDGFRANSVPGTEAKIALDKRLRAARETRKPVAPDSAREVRPRGDNRTPVP